MKPDGGDIINISLYQIVLCGQCTVENAVSLFMPRKLADWLLTGNVGSSLKYVNEMYVWQKMIRYHLESVGVWYL